MIPNFELLLTGLAEWTVPKGGMFLWIKVLGVKDTYKLVMEHGMKAGVTFLPGRECMADRTAPSPYIRASFSTVTLEQMEKVNLNFSFSKIQNEMTQNSHYVDL